MYLDIHLNVVCTGSYDSSPLCFAPRRPGNDYLDEDFPDLNETDASVRAPILLISNTESRC